MGTNTSACFVSFPGCFYEFGTWGPDGTFQEVVEEDYKRPNFLAVWKQAPLLTTFTDGLGGPLFCFLLIYSKCVSLVMCNLHGIECENNQIFIC